MRMWQKRLKADIIHYSWLENWDSLRRKYCSNSCWILPSLTVSSWLSPTAEGTLRIITLIYFLHDKQVILSCFTGSCKNKFNLDLLYTVLPSSGFIYPLWQQRCHLISTSAVINKSYFSWLLPHFAQKNTGRAHIFSCLSYVKRNPTLLSGPSHCGRIITFDSIISEQTCVLKKRMQREDMQLLVVQ